MPGRTVKKSGCFMQRQNGLVDTYIGTAAVVVVVVVVVVMVVVVVVVVVVLVVVVVVLVVVVVVVVRMTTTIPMSTHFILVMNYGRDFHCCELIHQIFTCSCYVKFEHCTHTHGQVISHSITQSQQNGHSEYSYILSPNTSCTD